MRRFDVMRLLRCVCAVLAFAAVSPCAAQELEPRRWSHLPQGFNFLGVGYAYTEADISDAPALRLEDVQAQVHTVVAKYIRSFEVFGRSARVEVAQGFQEGHWEGLLDGAPASVSRKGWTDTIARVAVNLYGAPPLTGQGYARYRSSRDVETIVGAALVVHLPTGEYFEDRLINIGSNRFTIRPQLGVVHTRGDWSLEMTGAAWIYTDNDEYFRGSKLSQDPLFTLQGHVTYEFRPGVWAGVSGGYGYGQESTLNGVKKNDRKKNAAVALTMGFPLRRDWGVKATYLATRRQAVNGNDTDTLSVAVSHFW